MPSLADSRGLHELLCFEPQIFDVLTLISTDQTQLPRDYLHNLDELSLHCARNPNEPLLGRSNVFHELYLQLPKPLLGLSNVFHELYLQLPIPSLFSHGLMQL